MKRWVTVNFNVNVTANVTVIVAVNVSVIVTVNVTANVAATVAVNISYTEDDTDRLVYYEGAIKMDSRLTGQFSSQGRNCGQRYLKSKPLRVSNSLFNYLH